ncbi:tRNA (adenosine(37)-N6)-methyltransferase TrmM [Pseudoalteromonas sp. MSK9-3]|uniref:tRNA1(Val) (adenine(37)-N6)-methyltransferase n=1 Tax=Pseudoalteromonas sp. MSK9-3 TaxID=1897633 RepID=UPI000E6CBC87|nr:methyltransferase [Pseudoalteromonas sp. MSK9-3]RJE76543.1 tRNA (adenosine(37)-N6)-methyltransferase TrmM [Pseudoalteromonas sp. MSK9-3]
MAGFAFKQFKVQQNNTAMKVSTDGILLGAWANIGDASSLLDIGTGTGLLALMCKQRNQSLAIDAVEIDEQAVKDARTNIKNSPWSDITVHQCAIQDFSSETKFDTVISNPPYFNHSLHSPDSARTKARHTAGLSFSELLSAFIRVSHSHSTLTVILPCVEAEMFTEHANVMGLHLHRVCHVQMTPTKPVSRRLMAFSLIPNKSMCASALCVRNSDNTYTPEYITLCQDFYLKM